MKKIISALTALIILFSGYAYADTIYEYKDEKYVTDGVKLTHLRQFTTDGWQNINIIEADLNNQYLSAKAMTPLVGNSVLQNMKDMSTDYNTVAAVNSDFFAWHGSTGTRGSSIGPVVENNKLITSASHDESFASFGINSDNSVFMQYVTSKITVTAPNGESIEIKHLNKYDDLAEPVIYTSDFWGETEGSYGPKLEMVIIDGIVTEMRRDMEGIKVPENGYVIRHLPEYNSFLIDNFKVGDKIDIKIDTSFDLNKVKELCGGGSYLVYEGKSTKLTHDIAGANPRTVAGYDKTGKKLYLITIDGRQTNAAGMTLPQVQSFLLNYGIYNAINFDGGGSTTLVTKDSLTNSQQVSNLPAGGNYLRPVAVGFGVSSSAPKGDFGGFEPFCGDNNIFVGSTRPFGIRNIVDTYKNYYDGEIPSVSWQIDSNYGYFDGATLHATKSGKDIKITATAGNITETMTIDIIDVPVKLTVSPSHFNVSNLEKAVFTVTGTNSQGYTAVIENTDCTLSDNSIKETGYKEISFGKAKGYITVSADNTDNFEKLDATGLYGTLALTSQAKSGSNAYKLSYDFFGNSDGAKASYIVLKAPKNIPNGYKQIGIWVYSPFASNQWIRAEMQNANGEILRGTFTESIDFAGWKYLTSKIPDNAKSVTKLYIVQNSNKEQNSGYLIFDDLAFISTDAEISLPSSLIKNEVQSGDIQSSDYSFSVIGNMPKTNTLLTKVLTSKASNALINSKSDKYWSLGCVDFYGIEERFIKSYASYSVGNSVFINLDNSDHYISKTQYSKLISELKTKYQNVFIFMYENPELMSNINELKVLKDILADYNAQNTFVFYPDSTTSITQSDNIKYISVGDINQTSANSAISFKEKMTFAKVILENGNPTLKFINIF